jgi:DNA repair protein RadD
MELRAYQQEAIDAIYKYFHDKTGNPLVVMPTGTGKSVVIAEFLRGALTNWPDTRVIVLTHVRELIQQNFNAMIRSWPDAPAGIYSAGLNRRELDQQIVFAGIQSIYKRAVDVQRCDLVLIDEAHLLGTNDTGMYRKFLGQLKEINPSLKVIGFTATPYRMDQGLLCEGDTALFSDIAIDVPMLRMIEEGFLAPLVPKATKTRLNTSGVHTRGGEFIASELEDAVNIDEVNRSAVAELVKAGDGLGSWLVFCCGVDHAKSIRDVVREHGITCEAVFGDMPAPDRDRILRDFKEGRLRCITNMNVLTTGFDAPGVDLIGMLRPTKSQSLYVQMLGRGTRIAEGKEECVVLDFAANTHRHGPVDTINSRIKAPPAKGDEKGEAMAKECPECQTLCALSAKVCPTCAFVFPVTVKFSGASKTGALLSTQIKSEWITVNSVLYGLHEKEGKTPSMRVTYQCGVQQYREWICVQHTGYPAEKAAIWWKNRTSIPVPRLATEAIRLTKTLRAPKAIRVRPNGQYFDIIGYKFE